MLVIKSDTLPVNPLTRVIVADMDTLLPGFSVTEEGEMERLPIPAGHATVKLNVLVVEDTPVPLALTVCVVVPVATLVDAVSVIVPVLPVPGWE